MQEGIINSPIGPVINYNPANLFRKPTFKATTNKYFSDI